MKIYKNIVLSESEIGDGVVILPLKKWQKMEKEIQRLKDVLRVVKNKKHE